MMLRNLKKREGFTLIELMIVVAIIGILAAIAIPNFIKFQLRSKASESKVNLAGIRTSQESYFAEAGTYVDWTSAPVAVPGQQKQPFSAAVPICNTPLVPGTDPGYCFVGWQPEGDVYYTYEVQAYVGGAATPFPTPSNQFWSVGTADIDGDTVNFNVWGINQPDSTGTAVVGTFGSFGPGCTLVLDSGSAASVFGQVGPCDSVDMGRNTF